MDGANKKESGRALSPSQLAVKNCVPSLTGWVVTMLGKHWFGNVPRSLTTIRMLYCTCLQFTSIPRNMWKSSQLSIPEVWLNVTMFTLYIMLQYYSNAFCNVDMLGRPFSIKMFKSHFPTEPVTWNPSLPLWPSPAAIAWLMWHWWWSPVLWRSAVQGTPAIHHYRRNMTHSQQEVKAKLLSLLIHRIFAVGAA